MSARTLAGTSGVPVPSERVYLHVVSETDELGAEQPIAVLWPDGRRFDVTSSVVLKELGRWELGTRTVCYEVTIRRNPRLTARRVIWWERGRWFARIVGSASVPRG